MNSGLIEVRLLLGIVLITTEFPVSARANISCSFEIEVPLSKYRVNFGGPDLTTRIGGNSNCIVEVNSGNNNWNSYGGRNVNCSGYRSIRARLSEFPRYSIRCLAPFPVEPTWDRIIPNGIFKVNYTNCAFDTCQDQHKNSFPYRVDLSFQEKLPGSNTTYTFFSNRDPGVRTEFQAFVSVVSKQLNHNKTTTFNLTMERNNTLKCVFSGDVGTSELALISAENPTKARLQLGCLRKFTVCTGKQISTNILHTNQRVISNAPASAIIQYGTKDVKFTLEYFTSVHGLIITNIRNMWRDFLVIDLRLDSEVELGRGFGFQRAHLLTNRSFEDELRDHERRPTIVFYETEMYSFQVSHIQYAVHESVVLPECFVNFQNGSSKRITSLKERSSTSIVRTNAFNLTATSRTTSLTCFVMYWNKVKYANDTRDVTVRRVSESVPPKFDQQRLDFSVLPRESLTLNCSAVEAEPEPLYHWEFNGKPLVSSPSVRVVQEMIHNDNARTWEAAIVTSVQITAVSQDTAGEYVCIARNVGGVAKQQFGVQLNIRGRNWWIYLTIALALVLILSLLLGLLIKKYFAQRRLLTCLEIQRFHEGDALRLKKEKFAHENAQYMPYNRDYEVPWKEFSMDNNELGSGAYGVVFKGIFRGRTVAVKTLRQDVDKSVVLALLSELKIMIHLGKHENVVELVGACTEFIDQGRVFVIVEYCRLGNLHSFLRRQEELKAGRVAYSNIPRTSIPSDPPLKIFDLDCMLNYAVQICRGMQHLQCKKVIHGDLAARNILLYSHNRVKITDFGLSRQLLNCNTYVKRQQQVLLPWGWMAIESLKNLEFTLKSDIWAFGVTLWEIFSGGKPPYPGMSWTLEFVDYLEENLRLSKPLLASDSIYKIMIDCWSRNPNDRPSFRELEQRLLSCSNSGRASSSSSFSKEDESVVWAESSLV